MSATVTMGRKKVLSKQTGKKEGESIEGFQAVKTAVVINSL